MRKGCIKRIDKNLQNIYLLTIDSQRISVFLKLDMHHEAKTDLLHRLDIDCRKEQRVMNGDVLIIYSYRIPPDITGQIFLKVSLVVVIKTFKNKMI
jgi:hypothetical protein